MVALQNAAQLVGGEIKLFLFSCQDGRQPGSLPVLPDRPVTQFGYGA